LFEFEKQACVNNPIKGFRNIKKYYTSGQAMVMGQINIVSSFQKRG